ncbi:MAG: TonB-dependent receptor [Halioglobus sp.]|nr:TonB-dependent receptor [Halioglobus sp.]
MSRIAFGSKMNVILMTIYPLFSCLAIAQNGALEEIIVTAQQRAQNLQDVSTSVTAFSGDAIDKFGFEDTRDLFYQTPNVDISQFSFYGGITIRGNPTLNNSLAGEGNVSLYFDSVYRPTAFYGGNEMLDVERVEVLRGPQGTLFGRNSTSGLVHFISRKPTEEREGYANLELGSYGTRILEGAISGPLSDRVRGRLALKYHENDGFQTNQGPSGGKFAVKDRFVGRGHLEIDISDDVNLLLSVEASDQDDIGKAFNYWGLLDPTTFEQCDPKRVRVGQCVGAGALFGLTTFGDPNPDVKRPYTEFDPDNGDGRSTLETLSATATLSWQLGDAMELISITAFDSHDRFFNPDEDASVDGVYGGYWSYNDHYTSESNQVTQEFRLTGSNGEIDWLAGFFYFDEARDSSSTIRDFETVQVPGTIVQLDTDSWAVFGELSKSLSDNLRIIAGMRYTDESKQTDVLTETIPGSQQLSETDVSGKLGLEWRPRDEWLVYATLSTGFRSGNFNTDLLFGDLSALTAVDSEKVKSFEVGSKSTLLDGRMRLNTAFFYQDVTDKQGTVYDSSSAAPVSRLISLGDADIFGAELEIFMVPTENLELILGVGWVDAEISAEAGFGYSANWGTGVNAGAGDFFLMDGSDLGGGLAINGVGRYHIPMVAGGNLTLQLDADWREDSIGVGGNHLSYSEDRILVNLRAFWTSPSERWELEAYVENVFNKKYIDNMGALAGSDSAYGNMGMPQWYGVKFGMHF